MAIHETTAAPTPENCGPLNQCERCRNLTAVEELRESGDTVELDNGRAIRLTIEPDYDTELNDFPDCYGLVEFARRNRNYGGWVRPEGFDGNAEVMSCGNSDPYWWQPPADVKRGTEGFEKLRRTVRELVEFGFVGVVVELRETLSDSHGNPHVVTVDTNSLWGIEWGVTGDYLAGTIRDLVDGWIGE